MDSKKEYQHGDYLINAEFREKLLAVQKEMQSTLKELIKEYGDKIFTDARQELLNLANNIDKSINIYYEGNNTLAALIVIFNMALIHLYGALEYCQFVEFQDRK